MSTLSESTKSQVTDAFTQLCAEYEAMGRADLICDSLIEMMKAACTKSGVGADFIEQFIDIALAASQSKGAN